MWQRRDVCLIRSSCHRYIFINWPKPHKLIRTNHEGGISALSPPYYEASLKCRLGSSFLFKPQGNSFTSFHRRAVLISSSVCVYRSSPERGSSSLYSTATSPHQLTSSSLFFLVCPLAEQVACFIKAWNRAVSEVQTASVWFCLVSQDKISRIFTTFP